jgi:acyl-coenzyme A thioesterase PaaI-like protein
VSRVPPLPPVFASLFAGREECRPPDAGQRYHDCFGCGPGHPTGLRVRCFADGAGVLSPIVIPAVYAGPPAAAHGGIVAACLDEVMAAAAARHAGRVCVTGELSVRFVKPTRVETPLLGRGRFVREAAKYLELEGSLEDLRSGTVVATGSGRFFPV